MHYGFYPLSSHQDDNKLGIKTTEVMGDQNVGEFNLIAPGLPTVCPLASSNPETNTTPPILNKLLPDQAKTAF